VQNQTFKNPQNSQPIQNSNKNPYKNSNKKSQLISVPKSSVLFAAVDSTRLHLPSWINFEGM
jgi:hypothetical protein